MAKLKVSNTVELYELGHFDLGLDLSVRHDTNWDKFRKKSLN